MLRTALQARSLPVLSCTVASTSRLPCTPSTRSFSSTSLVSGKREHPNPPLDLLIKENKKHWKTLYAQHLDDALRLQAHRLKAQDETPTSRDRVFEESEWPPSNTVWMGYFKVEDRRTIDEELSKWKPFVSVKLVRKTRNVKMASVTIEFSSIEAATQMVEDCKYDPISVGGRPLDVHFDIPILGNTLVTSAEASADSFRKQAKSRNLFITNLPFETDEAHVKQLFAKYGEVEAVGFTRERDGAPAQGWCTVRMATEDEAERIMDSHDEAPFMLGGRFLNVELHQYSARVKPTRRVRLEGFPPSQDETALYTWLADREMYPTKVVRRLDPATSAKTDVCWLEFATSSMAAKAIHQINKLKYQSKKLSAVFEKVLARGKFNTTDF